MTIAELRTELQHLLAENKRYTRKNAEGDYFRGMASAYEVIIAVIDRAGKGRTLEERVARLEQYVAERESGVAEFK